MVKTYIGASHSGFATVANETSYLRLGGDITKNTTETSRQTMFHSAGNITNLYVRVLTNAIVGTSTVLTRKNGTTDGNNTVSIGSTATGEFTDTTHTDAVVNGDKWSYKFVPGAATNTMTFSILSCIYAATTDTVTRLLANDNVSKATASTTWFLPLSGYQGATVVTVETNCKVRMRKAGTLKNCCVHVTTARATASTVKSRKNGGAANLSVSCTGGATGWFEDIVNTDTVSAGEDWNWSVTTGTGVDSLVIQAVCADFLSTGGDGVVVASNPFAPVAFTDGTTGFMIVSGRFDNIATEASTKADCRIAGDYSELTCLVTQNDCSTGGTVTLRKNGADSTLIASITGNTTGVFSDSTHTVTLVSTDEINYSITVPAVSGAHTVTITNIVMSTHITANTNYTVTLTTETTTISDSIARSKGQTRTMGGQSVSFDGVNDLVDCTNDATLWSQALTKFSFAFWIYPTAAWDGAERAIIDHGQSAQGFRCHFGAATAGKIIFRIRNAVDTFIEASTAAGIVSLNIWNHVICVYDNSLGSANLKIYVNSVVGATTANLTETINNSNILSLSDSTADYQGYMKDFRWWTTKALNSTEITDVYNNSAAAPTPNYWLKMTEGTGNPVDSISGTKVGTLTGGPVWTPTSPTVWAEKYDVSDSISTMKAAARALSDTTTISETLARMSGLNRALTTETVTSSDSIARVKGLVRALATETITITEVSLNRLLAAIRNPIETTSISETLARLLAANRALSTESTTISDSIARVKGLVRTIATETVTITEVSLTRLLAATRALATETTTVSDSLARVRGIMRALATETVSIGETLARLVAANRALSDTTTISDSINRIVGKVRALTENTSIGESLARMLAANRTVTENTTISDSINRVYGAVRALVENTSFSESLARMLGANRTLTENTTISETLARIKAVIRSLTDTTTISETLNRMLAAARTLTDTTTISDVLSYIKSGGASNLVRTLTENTTVSESLSRMLAANRALSDTTAISESLVRIVAVIRALTDTTVISDLLTKISGLTRALTDTVIVSESLSRIKGAVRTLTDTIIVGDNISRLLSASRLLATETTPLSEQLNRLVAATRSLSIETTTISDSLTKLRTVIKSLTENVIISDSINRVFTGTRTLIETVDITDSLTKLVTLFPGRTQLSTIVSWLKAKYSISNPPKV